MIEIRGHGRGGQGIVTAMELLAKAVFEQGKYPLAFPKFGPERSGAPVEAYCRIDDERILLRTQVYEPDYLIVLDSSLVSVVDIAKGLKKDSVIVINAKEREKIGPYKVHYVDATKIAVEILGRPIVNTAILGAFAKVTGIVKMENLEKAVNERFQGSLAEKNIQAMKRAFDEVL